VVQQLVSNVPFEELEEGFEQYPDSDGQPMADNTKQFRWIVVIKENLERLFASDSKVFVAGDLLWYPVEGDPKVRQAPDALVVFGRPKGDRGSYQQWKEAGIAPQVVFEILSPGNRPGEMLRKLNFYQRYGVEEYYIYDPDSEALTGLQRLSESLQLINEMAGWVSPRLGIRFVPGGGEGADELTIYRPDGEKFLTFVELGKQLATARMERQQDQQRIQSLEAKLRELGGDPEQI
jgi:Uma2 family endonuclease